MSVDFKGSSPLALRSRLLRSRVAASRRILAASRRAVLEKIDGLYREMVSIRLPVSQLGEYLFGVLAYQRGPAAQLPRGYTEAVRGTRIFNATTQLVMGDLNKELPRP